MRIEHVLLTTLLGASLYAVVMLLVDAWKTSCPRCSHPHRDHIKIVTEFCVETSVKSCAKCYDDGDICIRLDTADR